MKGIMPATTDPGESTRHKIMQAALDTLRVEGIRGTSARAIARHGGFNQALIFYHFGSVNDLLLEAAVADSTARVEAYRRQLEGLSSLPELAAVARQLSERDTSEGGITVVTQLLAGALGDPEIGRRLMQGFEPWIEVVATALRRTLEGTGFEDVLPIEDMAFAVVGLFLGIELLTRLDPERAPSESLFATFDSLGALMEGFIGPLRDQS